MKYRRKPTGEKKLFYKIWQERPHICVNCKVNLGNEAKTFNFAHIKPKGLYPELRLDPFNIILLCYECHYALDFQTEEKFNSRFREIDF